jgi:hypothetical protein
MTKEDKCILLQDLTTRLPYGVILDYSFIEGKQRIHTKIPLTYRNIGTVALDEWHTNEEIFKPYLRPMSSMTKEEYEQYRKFSYYGAAGYRNNDYKEMVATPSFEKMDFLNAHHFDYRGLIEKGLALEAPEGMYKVIQI